MRSGYSDDCDGWSLIRWRGAVASALRGQRGQAFLKELLKALDEQADGKLIANELEAGGQVCAIGAVGKARGIEMENLDPEDSPKLAHVFGIAEAMVREIEFMNDEAAYYNITPEQRFNIMRKWAEDNILEPVA